MGNLAFYGGSWEPLRNHVAIKTYNKNARKINPCQANVTWDKLFKNGPSKICGRQPLKNLKPSKYFKGCLPHILISPFLNTLIHMSIPPGSIRGTENGPLPWNELWNIFSNTREKILRPLKCATQQRFIM